MKDFGLTEHDRIRAYLGESALSQSLGDTFAPLLRFLVERTLADKAPHAKDIALDLDRMKEYADEDLTKIRDRISKLRGALNRYYAHKGKADAVVLSLPSNAERRGYRIDWSFVDQKLVPEAGGEPPLGNGDPPWVNTLVRSGLSNAFRIKQQNPDRLLRVASLIDDELRLVQPQFRLLASSGNSYLREMGPVWSQAGLASAVYDRKAAFQIVLESPFSDFAECRAIANGVETHHWHSRVNAPELERLMADCPNVSVHVTDIPVNCSLFLTSSSVFYDPYLWARPTSGLPTENNFWVLEFRKGEEDYNCYELLCKHFAFVLEHSMPLSIFMRTGPSFHARTKRFEQRVKMRLQKAKSKVLQV